MKVGFVFTSATQEMLCESPELALNLTDASETIEAVKCALEACGHTVTALNTDDRLPAILCEASFDIIFNIATGFYGDNRQANLPAMLEYLRIPHTGSSVLAEAVTQDKPTMKTILQAHSLPTPPFQVFHNSRERLTRKLRFPLIVKLPAEGGSLGLTPDSVVHNETELRAQVALLLEKYGQGALVEEYIEGREFTVSVLGNNPPYVLPIVERLYFGNIRIQLDEPEPAALDLYEQLTGQEYAYTLVDTRSIAPAKLTDKEVELVEKVTVGAYQVLSCRDWARIDLRMDAQGNVYILDVNLEPAIAPEYALAKAARAAGWTFTTLVNRILEHAVERYPHLREKQLCSETMAFMAAR
ncbi:MAG TPA: hypothetical protein VMT34_12160 [Aggregatilineales bacterium]|nr:hypothetical protein [Aggregatilineales bacterium]